jgi:hypothetical protein
MKAWKVSHVFAAPVAYQSGPLSYPRLGITLAGDRSAITGIDHELDVDDQLSKPEVVGISTLEVSLLVEVVRYRTGYCDILSRTPSLRAPLPGESVSTTTFTYQTGRAAIQRAADFPAEANLPSAPPRLRVWLRLAADASEMSPPDAIRNYYMAWEDMGLPSPIGSAGEELKFIRDFVSHGGLLTNPRLLAFLNRELHKPTDRYDPHDTDHQIFLAIRRQWARSLVETEINRHL